MDQKIQDFQKGQALTKAEMKDLKLKLKEMVIKNFRARAFGDEGFSKTSNNIFPDLLKMFKQKFQKIKNANLGLWVDQYEDFFHQEMANLR